MILIGERGKNKHSMHCGQRWAGGWRREGLPSTYKMDPERMYPPDVKALTQD